MALRSRCSILVFTDRLNTPVFFTVVKQNCDLFGTCVSELCGSVMRLSNGTFALRLWERGELQQGLWGPAGLSRGLALAGQPAVCGLPPLWRSRHLPLLDSHCSTLCGQVRPFHHASQSGGFGPIQLESIVSAVSLPCRASSPADWAVYAGIVDPLGTLFNPAYSVSRIITHEGYNSRTRRNDIALLRLSKPLDLTGAYRQIYIHKQQGPNQCRFIPLATKYILYLLCGNQLINVNVCVQRDSTQ